MTGNVEMVEVYLEPRVKRGKAQAFYAGENEPCGREIWVWLPISQITVHNDGNGESKAKRVDLPDWLAFDKELEVET